MRKFLPTSAMLLAITATAASAAPVTFSYTGGFQSYTASTTGLYNILAFGAQGGSGSGGFGGGGADIGADFTLTAGEVLRIAVGGTGSGGDTGGGGGGSFVVGPNNTALVIAAGGGGSGGDNGGGGGSANATRSGRFVTAGADGAAGGMQGCSTLTNGGE